MLLTLTALEAHTLVHWNLSSTTRFTADTCIALQEAAGYPTELHPLESFYLTQQQDGMYRARWSCPRTPLQ